MPSLLLPLISIAGEKLGNACDKINFNKNKIKPKNEIFLVFSVMLLGSLSGFFILGQELPQYSLEILSLLLLIIGISFFQNVFQFNGLSKVDLQAREPIMLLGPIITAVIAFALFPSEREIKYLIAIFLSVFILLAFNFKKGLKIKFNTGILYVIGAVLASSILANIYKFSLGTINAESLLFFRALGLLGLLLIFKQVTFGSKGFPQGSIKWGLLAGLLYFVGHLARLYSIQEIGLNLTVLLLFLGPVFTFFISFFVLKEKVEIKNIISSFLILLIIIITFLI